MILFNLLLFFLALSILIFIHEMGHYLFAKLFGVYCHEFSLGMGPAILKKKFKKDKETTYCIRAFPIGGYVSMAGEAAINEKDKEVPYERTINGIKAWKRAIVVVAGVTLNFLFGLLLIFVVVFAGGISTYQNGSAVNVTEDSVAYVAGLRTDDVIKNILIDGGNNDVCSSGCSINSQEDIFVYINASVPDENNIEQTITITYLRDNVESSLNLTRTYDEETSTYTTLGINAIMIPYHPGFFEGIKLSFEKFGEVISSMFRAFGSLFTKEDFSSVGGPVEIYRISSSQASQGVVPYIWFLSILSINLGFFNLLPFPGLDGSRFYTSIYEIVSNRKVNPKIESYVNAAGIILLFALMIVITIKDVVGLF